MPVTQFDTSMSSKSTVNGYKQMSTEQCGSVLSGNICVCVCVKLTDLYAAYRE